MVDATTTKRTTTITAQAKLASCCSQWTTLLFGLILPLRCIGCLKCPPRTTAMYGQQPDRMVGDGKLAVDLWCQQRIDKSRIKDDNQVLAMCRPSTTHHWLVPCRNPNWSGVDRTDRQNHQISTNRTGGWMISFLLVKQKRLPKKSMYCLVKSAQWISMGWFMGIGTIYDIILSHLWYHISYYHTITFEGLPANIRPIQFYRRL